MNKEQIKTQLECKLDEMESNLNAFDQIDTKSYIKGFIEATKYALLLLKNLE